MPSRAKDPVEPALPKGIGRPATSALAVIGVTRLEQVARFTEKELLALHGVGPKAVRVLEAALLEKGLSLAKAR
ncbi:DNA-binding protein [Archangium sp. Cb G35]|uniref:DNA-binding protein n=1 Tax=Archangium sp. Cb G35 TaxID=1920190 RepID=UPI0009371984|nr:DNA-binding protein [Archangium sp. Cb G35]OJT21106.1 DNA-binding protein [Archangium sp. Cb G35]